MKKHLSIPPVELARLPVGLDGFLHLLRPHAALRQPPLPLPLPEAFRDARLDARPDAVVGDSAGMRVDGRGELVQAFCGP